MTKAGTGSGTIVSAPAGINCGTDCSEAYVGGTKVTLTATPVAGSVFTGWSGACTGISICNLQTVKTEVLTANFSKPQLPNPPSQIQIVLDNGTVTLTWAPIEIGTDYDVCLSTEHINEVLPDCTKYQNGMLFPNKKSPFLIMDLSNEKTYHLRITAKNSFGFKVSKEILVTPYSLGLQALALGKGHTCGLISGGVKCWGYNRDGELGNGNALNSLKPVQTIPGASGVTFIESGAYHTCAIVNEGVKCWGLNFYGEIGDHTNITKLLPVQVFAQGSGVSNLSAGKYHTCAVLNGGVQCWGQNKYGELGDGTNIDKNYPVQVIPSNSGVTAIAAGAFHTCAIINSGVQCWGQNVYGQLGDNSKNNRLIPVQVVPANSNVNGITAGNYHTCALINRGVKCWGYGGDGQVTERSNIRPDLHDYLTPLEAIAATSDVTSVSAGDNHTCALIKGGLYCWGSNTYGELGDGSSIDKYIPTQVFPVNTGMSAVISGGNHTCSIFKGELWCWGYNGEGQLGDESIINKLKPLKGFQF